MPTLKIYNLDDQEESLPVSELSEGEHIIGREKLNCKDKRISRNHALITINTNLVTLKATHINPSFYKPNGGNSIQLVQKDSYVTLNDGDQFSLLPHEFWFRIRVAENEELPGYNQCLKRSHEEESTEDNKKIKLNEIAHTSQRPTSDSEESVDFAEPTVHHNSALNDSPEDKTNSNTVPKESKKETSSTNGIEQTEDSKSNHKEIVSDSDSTCNEEEADKPNSGDTNNKGDNEEEGDKPNSDDTNNKGDTTQNNPSTSKSKDKRDRCWYGKKCYRKNPNHRTNHSHPGDSDYDTDSEDDRPVCPFGDSCYRTNLIHRKQFKHSKPPAPKPDNTHNNSNQTDSDESDDDNNAGKGKRKAAAKPKKYAETPEDDYDVDDPFINDGSSDDFEISDGDESADSDGEDYPEEDVESQEIRRLVKEAKKFNKKKNRK